MATVCAGPRWSAWVCDIGVEGGRKYTHRYIREHISQQSRAHLHDAAVHRQWCIVGTCACVCGIATLDGSASACALHHLQNLPRQNSRQADGQERGHLQPTCQHAFINMHVCMLACLLLRVQVSQPACLLTFACLPLPARRQEGGPGAAIAFKPECSALACSHRLNVLHLWPHPGQQQYHACDHGRSAERDCEARAARLSLLRGPARHEARWRAPHEGGADGAAALPGLSPQIQAASREIPKEVRDAGKRRGWGRDSEAESGGEEDRPAFGRRTSA
eukprot:366546-Chlamydomonas_euryale.AAC.57